MIRSLFCCFQTILKSIGEILLFSKNKNDEIVIKKQEYQQPYNSSLPNEKNENISQIPSTPQRNTASSSPSSFHSALSPCGVESSPYLQKALLSSYSSPIISTPQSFNTSNAEEQVSPKQLTFDQPINANDDDKIYDDNNDNIEDESEYHFNDNKNRTMDSFEKKHQSVSSPERQSLSPLKLGNNPKETALSVAKEVTEDSSFGNIEQDRNAMAYIFFDLVFKQLQWLVVMVMAGKVKQKYKSNSSRQQ